MNFLLQKAVHGNPKIYESLFKFQKLLIEILFENHDYIQAWYILKEMVYHNIILFLPISHRKHMLKQIKTIRISCTPITSFRFVAGLLGTIKKL